MRQPIAALHQLRDAQPDHVLFRVFRELDSLKEHWRSCVVLAHGLLELLVNELIEEKSTKPARNMSHFAKLNLLRELHLIDDNQFRAFTWFRQLRNRAAHDVQFEKTNSDLRIFRNTSFADSEFHVQCMVVIASLWNQHHEVFSRRIFPTIHCLEASSA
jgi:hypothetical protein